MYRRILKPIHADYIAFIREPDACERLLPHGRRRVRPARRPRGDRRGHREPRPDVGRADVGPRRAQAPLRRHGSSSAARSTRSTSCRTGTPDEVRGEVKRVIDVLGPGGGYMLASVHTIMNEVPPENILAMVDAAVEHGTYPLRVTVAGRRRPMPLATMGDGTGRTASTGTEATDGLGRVRRAVAACALRDLLVRRRRCSWTSCSCRRCRRSRRVGPRGRTRDRAADDDGDADRGARSDRLRASSVARVGAAQRCRERHVRLQRRSTG